MRAALFLSFLAGWLHANAVSVYIAVNEQPFCSSATGSLSAIADGGAGPYTYLWSPGGETTQYVNNLPAGTYSVTVTDNNGEQASDQIELTAGGYALTTSSVWHNGFCNGMAKVAVFPADHPGFGPPPYSMAGEPMTLVDDFGMTAYVGELPAPPDFYGQFLQVPFADGNGCSGTINAYIGWPLEWPEVTILDVQGSCSGGSNGSITFTVGEEGHQQQVDYYVTSTEEGSGTVYGGGGSGTQVATGLAAGDHWIVLSGGSYPSQSGYGCYDSTLVSVPDLGTSCGSVGGKVFMDYDADCAQVGEPGVPGILLEVQPGPYYALTNSSGDYTVNLPLGSFTVQQISTSLAEHCTGAPIPVNVTGNITGVNLADTSLVALDAKITGAYGPARPGFTFQTTLALRNLTPATTGNLTTVLTFDPTFSYAGSSPVGNVSGNTVTWDQNALDAFQESNIHVYLQVPSDISLLGTTLNNAAVLTTANSDADLSNNTVPLPVMVTGSFDPNEKVATTSSGSSASLYYVDLDEWIDYTIHFQNTGTDTAFNVVVTDTMPQELDLATLEVRAASHAYSVSITDGHVLRWAFDNIQLPDSNVNELKSHGFVSFRIRPSQPLLSGTVIANTANIYFDFNAPVITEPCVLTTEIGTGITTHAGHSLRLAPNPVSDVLVAMDVDDAQGVAEVLAADGRQVPVPVVRMGSTLWLDVHALAPGLYVLRTGMGTARFVKQ